MKKYNITVRHDGGTVVIRVTAKDKKAAKGIILKSEYCPSSAITKIVEIQTN